MHQKVPVAQMLLEQMVVVLRPVVRTEQVAVPQRVGQVQESELQMALVPV